jgi:hypothetical protein
MVPCRSITNTARLAIPFSPIMSGFTTSYARMASLLKSLRSGNCSRVDAAAEHLGLREMIQWTKLVAERAELLRADRAEGCREERQHDRRLVGVLIERDGVTVLVRQREIRGLASKVGRHGVSSREDSIPRDRLAEPAPVSLRLSVGATGCFSV